MNKKGYIIAYDVGTTALKTCLYQMNGHLHRIASASEGYELNFTEAGGAEQDPQAWWNAMCRTTREVISNSGVDPAEVTGISFCAQMQGVVLVDRNGEAVRPAMSYMDNRGKAEMNRIIGGHPKIEGANAVKLLKAIGITGVAPTSAKDPVWKYNWVKTNEADRFSRVHKWLDVKEYLVAKASGEFVMTEDSAFASMLMDVRKRQFSPAVCRMLEVDMNHLPRIVTSTETAGFITEDAAKALGLKAGTSVCAGGGDASLLGVGAGATAVGATHIYMGTSGWVSTVVSRPMLDINSRIAAIVGANHNTYNYFAELETAGKCVEWVKDHLAFEEIRNVVGDDSVSEESVKLDLYDYMMDAIKDVPPGSNGVIFTPWLHGNQSPFEDPSAKGMFFNLGLNNGKRDMIHAVLEGVCFHLRWQLEASEKKTLTSRTVRLVGGGALASVTCQILSDILGRVVEVVYEPQNAGAMGAAILTAIGTGWVKDIEEAGKLVEVEHTYQPDHDLKVFYDRQFEAFKELYTNNRGTFAKLNG